MHKFKISEDLVSVLDRQQTQLMVTTVVSGLGLLFVTIASAVTELDHPERLDALEEG